MAITTLIDSARVRAETAIRQLDWAAPLVARITLGVLFMSTGWGKVHSLDKVAGFFTELGIPAPAFHAVFVSYIELIGGAALLFGLASRAAAVPLLVSMAVAIVTAKRDEITGLSDLFGLVEWTYLALLAWVALAGPGRASLDHFLFSKSKAARVSSASSEPSFSAKQPA